MGIDVLAFTRAVDEKCAFRRVQRDPPLRARLHWSDAPRVSSVSDSGSVETVNGLDEADSAGGGEIDRRKDRLRRLSCNQLLGRVPSTLCSITGPVLTVSA